MNKKLKLIYITISILLLSPEIAIPSELKIKECKLYTIDKGKKGEFIYRGDKKYALEDGKYLRLEVLDYKEDISSATDFIDIVPVIANLGNDKAENVEVRLAISPKIGNIMFLDEEEGIIDRKATEELSIWFNPKILIKKYITEIKENSSQEIIIQFNLDELFTIYFNKRLWICELMFMLSIEPQGNEKSLEDNSIKIIVKIPIGPT